MKKILFAATVLCMMGCQNKPTNSTPALDPSNMDTSVAPNESFYQYATGGWQAKNPLKPEHSSYNMFNVLSDNNEIRINELFTQRTLRRARSIRKSPTSTSWASTRYA